MKEEMRGKYGKRRDTHNTPHLEEIHCVNDRDRQKKTCVHRPKNECEPGRLPVDRLRR